MPGSTYLLIISVQRAIEIRVRSGQDFFLEPGLYIYVGSAKGRLKPRLTRHFRHEKKLFWNIDYLLAEFKPFLVLVLKPDYDEVTTALMLSYRLQFVRNFGAADDPINVSHLFYFKGSAKELLDIIPDILVN